MSPALDAFFPKLESFPDVYTHGHDEQPASERPVTMGPIFDPSSCSIPLPSHTELFLQTNYPKLSEDTDGPVETPPTPISLTDPYLYPVMNRNERLRLTMLWYMMQDAMQDANLIARLQEKVNLVKDFVGWEYCIMGILDNNKFTRVATAGLPLAILPRRESTCSHTINQPTGSVFWISDLNKDWRFKESPHVAHGGLRSYAGTALLCHTIDGTEVPLGSLCVASDKPDMELSTAQKKALRRVAHMLIKEVVTTRRLSRYRIRQSMSDSVHKFEGQIDHIDFETRLLDVIRGFYPGTVVSLLEATDGGVRLQDGSVLTTNEAQNSLWEDADLIEELLQTQNHKELQTDRTVRAVLSQAGSFGQPIFLVVETSEVPLIFDDVDAWFIERCARMVWDSSQRRLLAEAMRAKETFLRGITHQLRTPIHGVLGAVELLAEELNNVEKGRMTLELNGTGSQPATPISLTNGTNDARSDESPEASMSLPVPTLTNGTGLAGTKNRLKQQAPEKTLQFLETINSSGRELMTTVNNILKLNRWEELSLSLKREPVLVCAEQLECDIVKDLGETLSAEEMMDVSLIFDNHLRDGAEIATADGTLLRDCVQALIVNAIQWAPKGSVHVTIRREGTILHVVVSDDGSGIPPEFHKIIFQPYEKVNPHTRGAGLGLTLAFKIAEALGGRLSLSWSEMGVGSKFSLEFPEAGLASSAGSSSRRTESGIHFKVHMITSDGHESVHPLSKYLASKLEGEALNRSESCTVRPDTIFEIDLVNFSRDSSIFEDRLMSVDRSRVAICIAPSKSSLKPIDTEAHRKTVRFFHGPLTTRRLNELLSKISQICSKRAVEKTKNTSTTKITRIVPKLETRFPVLSKAFFPVALLVDDNPINLTILRMFCRKRAIPYHEATDGEQAVRKFQSEQSPPITLVLMDLQMPICDGLVATTRIRELEADAKASPAAIFMVTGQDSPKDKADSLRAGADEFMVKPVKMTALDEIISIYFGSSAESTPA